MSARGQIMGGGVRKAFASKGDDATLTRFVKVEPTKRHQPRQARLPGFEAPYIQEGRTKFAKSVKSVSALPHLLVSGHNNVKIGRDVRKGHLRGYWIYTLSLEERRTCPRSCAHWQSCYGNNMPFAKRIDHEDPNFLWTLEQEVKELCLGRHYESNRGSRPKRKGVLIRLHALGDFFSVEYVLFWNRLLGKYPNLAIYGYTAYQTSGTIGLQIAAMNEHFGERCMIRFSNGGYGEMSTVTIGSEESCPSNAFICPEQTGKTLACATCGACWATTKNVAFLEH